MLNNSENFKVTDNDNKAKLSVTVEYKPEAPYLITEGRIEHLEEIATQIEKYENSEPKWDHLNNFRSFFATLLLAGVCLIIPIKLEKTTVDPVLYNWVLIITFASLCGAIFTQYVCHTQAKERKDQYANESRKIRAILLKVTQSVIRS